MQCGQASSAEADLLQLGYKERASSLCRCLCLQSWPSAPSRRLFPGLQMRLLTRCHPHTWQDGKCRVAQKAYFASTPANEGEKVQTNLLKAINGNGHTHNSTTSANREDTSTHRHTP
jgi:hypothetical protein